MTEVPVDHNQSGPEPSIPEILEARDRKRLKAVAQEGKDEDAAEVDELAFRAREDQDTE